MQKGGLYKAAGRRGISLLEVSLRLGRTHAISLKHGGPGEIPLEGLIRATLYTGILKPGNTCERISGTT